jgi:hypothetical protein
MSMRSGRGRVGSSSTDCLRCPRVHIVLATSDLHLEKKLNMTRSQCATWEAHCLRDLGRAYLNGSGARTDDANQVGNLELYPQPSRLADRPWKWLINLLSTAVSRLGRSVCLRLDSCC